MKNLNDIQQLFQLGQQMQSRMAEAQERLEKETVTAATGGGLVEVTADGKGSIRTIRIDPSAVDPSDVEMLEDLVLAAVSEAQRRARELLETEMRKAAGGMPLPGLGSLLG
ncbi:MAG: YbaB/EbfC family nucleoid-associated protein [Gemmatimonadota bacterium]|nr:YbaB/EbfC family nucleoid-associated protein [Gemmatimonadota bacterium]